MQQNLFSLVECLLRDWFLRCYRASRIFKYTSHESKVATLFKQAIDKSNRRSLALVDQYFQVNF